MRPYAARRELDKRSHRKAQQTNAAMRQRGNWQQATVAAGAAEAAEGAAASWPASAIATIFLANLAMT